MYLAGDGSLLPLGGGLDPLLGDEGLEDPGVGVLGVAKIDNLIQNLVDEDKVVLHILLANFAKVVLHHLDHFEEELKDHGGVNILLSDRRKPQVGSLDVEVGGPGDVGHRGPDLTSGVDHVHAEGVHSIAANVIPIHSRDQHLDKDNIQKNVQSSRLDDLLILSSLICS